jgi:hypothetical protein
VFQIHIVINLLVISLPFCYCLFSISSGSIGVLGMVRTPQSQTVYLLLMRNPWGSCSQDNQCRSSTKIDLSPTLIESEEQTLDGSIKISGTQTRWHQIWCFICSLTRKFGGTRIAKLIAPASVPQIVSCISFAEFLGVRSIAFRCDSWLVPRASRSAVTMWSLKVLKDLVGSIFGI